MSIINTKKAIKELLKLNIKSEDDLMRAKRKIAKKYKIRILSNAEILEELNNSVETQNFASLRKILRKRPVRTLSGIAPVAVLTKPYSCPGKCAYCPTEPGVPQSYLSNEPAVMRAIRCNYEPYKQVQLRLRALEANGHEPTKIELIVIGGTWSVLPDKYKYWYVKECFRGANEYDRNKKQKTKNKIQKCKNAKILKEQLLKEQHKNEKAKYKIVGLTLETRPDYIDKKELWQMRELGCTRVEIGVQAIDDKILKLNKRGHSVDEIVKATKLLKDFAFKVTYHIMPGLLGSSAGKDLKMFKQLFADQRFQPDQIKFYPTVVTKGSLLYKWWKSGKYRPYSDKVLQNLIIKCKRIVPAYVRIIRLIRDIPGESIIAGNLITNLRQIMTDKGIKCQCIRCREIRNWKLEIRNLKLETLKYKASGGEEYFLQFVNKNKKKLYGFCRLRLNSHNTKHTTHNIFNGVALIRELHVYGELVPVGTSASSAQEAKRVQHSGIGKKLLIKAEKIAKQHGYKKIAVISGVGARDYYRKLGYALKNSYMFKNLTEKI